MDYIPNIHLFSLYNQHYFYDVNTNIIMEVPKDIYVFLQTISSEKGINVKKEFESLKENDKKEINYLLSKGLLRKRETTCSICHPETEVLLNLNYFYNNHIALPFQNDRCYM